MRRQKQIKQKQMNRKKPYQIRGTGKALGSQQFVKIGRIRRTRGVLTHPDNSASCTDQIGAPWRTMPVFTTVADAADESLRKPRR
ncbi:hypothetical protein [Rhodanobacter denitrificans]|uniref:hypothetical protein n=1 Tax=Rhodanobacter denitrificans TaxID=666685 RepID=UPI0012FDD8EE|nr:hypothetical protein [Rhodanobacter denitrificans]UJM87949.1 hypothetical protein LRJ86_06530 [Rhodanobacter denitrificans]